VLEVTDWVMDRPLSFVSVIVVSYLIFLWFMLRDLPRID